MHDLKGVSGIYLRVETAKWRGNGLRAYGNTTLALQITDEGCVNTYTVSTNLLFALHPALVHYLQQRKMRN